MPLFLSDEDLSRLSGDTTAVVAKADTFIRGLLNELDTVRAKADASDIIAEQNCSLVEQKYLSLSAKFSNLQSSFDQHLRDLSDAQAKNHQFQLQSVEKDSEIERLRTEVSELHKSKRQLIELNEQKDLELSEKTTTIRSYLDKIVHSTENAAHKEARLSELEAEMGRCRAACTRMEQEKEIVERQNAWLNEELTSKTNSFLELRRKHSESETNISSKLADVERQLSECSKSLQWNKDRVRELEMKLKSTQEELISAKDAAATNEEQLSSELSTVNKLNELYKESSEEWSRKAADLEGAIKVMESHLKQVEDDYKDRLEKEFSVRKQFEKEAADLKEKLEKREAEIESSKKMNELSILPLRTFSTEPRLTSVAADITDEGNNVIVPKLPVGVSGTALAASLLRDGWSLAKMYSKYQEAVDALRHEQLGRKESEAILQRVLYKLEEKAEAIEDERVEHEKMADAYSLMNQKLQNSLNENSYFEKTILELEADLKRHECDYNLAHKEIDDLRRQVTVLLKECQDIQVRCGSFGNNINANATNIASRTSTDTEAENFISEHLLTFKDINGLVEQNVQLKSLVRSLSRQLENQEVEFKEKLEMELKRHTEESASKVAVVLQRAEEQGQMIESLHASVAMYKRLYEEEHSLHLSHTHSSDALAAAAEAGRNNVKTSIESSQEAAKKSLEKAAERVRCLEDDLGKSRSEIIVLRSERDKMELEANFVRERLDRFMKEFDYQKAEAKDILARNVEFSQLVVDYQRKLRESSESLNAAEELSRSLSTELSALKNEKEVLSNAEKRASDEVHNLSERMYLLQATLGSMQSAEEVREEARVAESVKQEEHSKQLEREWAEAKKELQEERENVRRLALDQDQTIKNSLRQVEDMSKELANALGALASAESRAAVAEAKLSSIQKQMSSTDGKVTAELQTAKEEIEKLKEEVHANKAHMLQYKSIAEVNEDALKQIESTHEDYKIKAVSATARKEETLTSALVEITNLREEIFTKTSQISEMEIQMSGLKEHLDKEHQKWRSAQTNYERQVVLLSETIQELTKTSETLASLQEEASKLRKLTEAQQIENGELKAKWEEEKPKLEKSKCDAEKKYDEINEQNKILHSQLEAVSSGNSGDTFGDAGLQSVVNYLRRSKENAEAELSLLKQEKRILQSQLESALKAAKSAQAYLEAQRSLMFTEEEFTSLLLQVREMNLLRESNVQLREENKHNFEECQKLREKTRAEIENLENQLREKEIELKGRKNEIEILKAEKEHLNLKISEDKLKDRVPQSEETGKIISEKQESLSRLEQDLSNCKLELEKEKRINEILKSEDAENLKEVMSLHQANLKQNAQSLKEVLSLHKKKLDLFSRENEDLLKKNHQLSKQLDEIQQGKKSVSDTTGEQAMNQEKDTGVTLEKILDGVRTELNKENEDKSVDKNEQLVSEKAIIDSYTNVEFGGRATLGDTSKFTDTSAAATGSLVHAQPPSSIPLADPVTNSLQPKAALAKSSIETRKTARRWVRSRRVEQSEPGHSSDTETQNSFTSSSQAVARKRVAPESTSELREESVSPSEKSSDGVGPAFKKFKRAKSPEESGEEQPDTNPEFTRNDEETAVGKDEETKDQLHLDVTIKPDLKVTEKSFENLDQTAQTKIMSDEEQKDSEAEEGDSLEAGDLEGQNRESDAEGDSLEAGDLEDENRESDVADGYDNLVDATKNQDSPDEVAEPASVANDQ